MFQETTPELRPKLLLHLIDRMPSGADSLEDYAEMAAVLVKMKDEFQILDPLLPRD